MSTGSVAASYRGLFAEPMLRRLAVADVCARLPQGMVSITLLLVVAQHASMAVAGLVVTAALANAAVSATEVALTAYVRHHHALWASGPLLAEVSIGSILGSLLVGARVPAAGLEPRDRRLARLLAGYAGGLALLTAAGLYAPLLAVAAPLAGFCLGPTLATLFSTAASAAPRGGGIQTQAWLNSIMNGGAAAGAALAGFAAGRPILALAAALAAAAAAATAAITGARTITRAHSAPRSVERETAPGRSGPRLRRQAHQEVRR